MAGVKFGEMGKSVNSSIFTMFEFRVTVVETYDVTVQHATRQCDACIYMVACVQRDFTEFLEILRLEPSCTRFQDLVFK